MSTPQDIDVETGEVVDEYIDILHDRIQFLTEELEEAERTVLEMRQNGGTLDGNASSGTSASPEVEDDIREVTRYVRFLATRADINSDRVETIGESLEEFLMEEAGDDETGIHDCALALWLFLTNIEENARD